MAYHDHELEWLLGQSLPMFIGRVSRSEARICLYPTLYVNQAVLALHAKEVTLLFDRSASPPWTGGTEGSATVCLGPPLLSWTLAQMDEPTWYGILKRFLGIARHELDLLSLRQCSEVGWSTNDKDSIRSSPG